MMRHVKIGAMVMLVLLVAMPAWAAPYRDGDTVTILVPYAAGGGFDTYARLVQPYVEVELGKITGVKVNVIVQNLPGGGGQVALEKLYRSRPDGKTLSIMSSGLAASQQVLYDAKFDLSKGTYLAQIDRAERSYIVRKGAFTASNFNDLIKRSHEKPVLIGTVGLSAASEQFLMQALLEEAGAKFNVDYVHFRGTSEAIASMLRGEIEAYQVTTSGGNKYVKQNPNDLAWFVTLGLESSAVDPTIPTMKEQGVPNARLIANTTGYTRRVFLGPPGLEEDVTKALRKAFSSGIQSDEFLARAKKAGRPIIYQPGEEIASIMGEAVETLTKYKDVIKARLKKQ